MRRHPENAVASASISSALMLLHSRHLASISSGWPVWGWESCQPLRLDLPQQIPTPQAPTPPLWVSDRALVALQAPIGALSTRELSGMILPQPPALQIFIRAQAVPAADMAA